MFVRRLNQSDYLLVPSHQKTSSPSLAVLLIDKAALYFDENSWQTKRLNWLKYYSNYPVAKKWLWSVFQLLMTISAVPPSSKRLYKAQHRVRLHHQRLCTDQNHQRRSSSCRGGLIPLFLELLRILTLPFHGKDSLGSGRTLISYPSSVLRSFYQFLEAWPLC